MNCERCGNVSNLMGSQGLSVTVRRFRQCPKCGYKFYTYEISEKNLKIAYEVIERTKLG